jgi:hypothetical protein
MLDPAVLYFAYQILKKSNRRPKIYPAADENQVIFFIWPKPINGSSQLELIPVSVALSV